MAFIVEMVWGRPPFLRIYGEGENGEIVLKEVRPTEDPPDPEWREFSCHGHVWEAVLALGRQYGWQPAGAVPAEGSLERSATHPDGIDASYEPSDWSYPKMMTIGDARALADALEQALKDYLGRDALRRLAARLRAIMRRLGLQRVTRTRPLDGRLPRPTLLRSDMTPQELAAANRPLDPGFIADFVAFLRRGPFTFAWDD